MTCKTAFGGVGQALSSRNYRLYWLGNIVSILGFWLHKLALGWLTWELTESPFWLGVIGFSALFPSFILSPYTGAIADRFGMRKVASWALIFSCISACILGLMVHLNVISIQLVCILTLIQGTALAFDLPSRQGLVYSLVDRKVLSSAIALNTTTFHMGAFIGPALFGIIITILDMEWAFFANSASFAFFFWSLQALKLTKNESIGTLSKGIGFEMIDGIRYVFNHPGIQALFLMAMVPHILIRPFIDLLPGFSANVFGQGTDGIAVLAGSFGLGSFIFGVWLALRGKISGLARIHVISILTSTVFMFGFAATNIFWFAVPCLFIVGMSTIAFAVANQSLIQNAVDPSKRGRVIGLSTGLAVGLPAIGALILGSLGERFGLQVPVGSAMIFGILFWLWSARRVMRQASLLENTPT